MSDRYLPTRIWIMPTTWRPDGCANQAMVWDKPSAQGDDMDYVRGDLHERLVADAVAAALENRWGQPAPPEDDGFVTVYPNVRN